MEVGAEEQTTIVQYYHFVPLSVRVHQLVLTEDRTATIDFGCKIHDATDITKKKIIISAAVISPLCEAKLNFVAKEAKRNELCIY